MNRNWNGERDPLVALAAGDPELFESFVTSEMGTLLGFFRRLGGSQAEIEDLAQDTVVKLYRSAHLYSPSNRFDAFVFRTARNVWIDSRRKAGVRAHLISSSSEEGSSALMEVESEDREPFEAVESEERAEMLNSAVAQLSATHRMAFELGVIQGLPYAQVGEILEVPIGTVKSRVHNAVIKLRDILERGGIR